MTRRVLDAVSSFVAALGAVAVGAIMVLTVADVIRRALTDRSIQGVVEVAPLLLLAATALGLGLAEGRRIHVRTSMLTSRLPLLPRLIVRATGSLISMAVLAWIAWESLERAMTSLSNDDVTPGFVALPIWPALVLVPLGYALFAAYVVLEIVDDVQAIRTGGPDPVDDSLEVPVV